MRIALALRLAFACLVVAAVAAGLAIARAPRATAASDCASLGEAANFAVFSNGAFNATKSSGTSITGRIAAAGDVTLDGVFVGPAAGDSTPTVVAGGNFTAGRTTGSGGTLNGGVRYGGSIDVAPGFVVNGEREHAAPPFSFGDQFQSLELLSASLADLDQTAGATVVLNQYSRALELTGRASGLNVFTVSAAQLAQAAGIVINLTQSGATALVNVTTDTDLTIAPMYENLSGAAKAAGIMWNFPLATSLAVNTGVSWQGSILAPNASVTSSGHPQLHGQLIAKTVPSDDWVIDRVTSTVCLPQPPGPPDTTLTLAPLCVDGLGNLAMRLRNTGDSTRHVQWDDLTGGDFGQFDVPPHRDWFFNVRGGGGASVIRAVSGSTTLQTNGTDRACTGQITVHLVTEGDVPAGRSWTVHVTNGENGNFSQDLTLASDESGTVTVPGGYVSGPAAIGDVVGGFLYALSVDDPNGAVTTTISLNPVEILDGQHEYVIVTLSYTTGTPGITPPVEPGGPDQPTLPPGSPDPPPGPDLNGSASGADLSITHKVAPARIRVGGTVQSVTVVRNIGDRAAMGVVAREIPQYHPKQANSVAHVLSLTTTAGKCTQRRPVRCSLRALSPGAKVTIRTQTRVLVARALRSVVVVSSNTAETNTANNIAVADLLASAGRQSIHAGIVAPPSGRVARPLSYRVTVTGGRPSGAESVRLCSRPPASLVQVRAPGTFRFRGQYCRDYPNLGRGHTASFLVYGSPSRTGRLRATARATAVDVARASRAAAHITVGAAVACPASVRPPARLGTPLAHAAC